MVVPLGVRAFERRQEHIGLIENRRRQPPACAEQDHRGPCGARHASPRSCVGRGAALIAASRSSRTRRRPSRPPSAAYASSSDGTTESSAIAGSRVGILRAPEPFTQWFLIRSASSRCAATGCTMKTCADAVRARASREIVQVEVGDGGGDDRALTVENRVVHERDGHGAHRPLPLRCPAGAWRPRA